MKDDLIVDRTGEDAISTETTKAERYANYTAYLELTQMQYSTDEILAHLSMTDKQLVALIDEFDPGQE